MSIIYNLTQHKCTGEQASQGVINLEGNDHERLVNLLTFIGVPSMKQINHKVKLLGELMSKYNPDLSDEIAFMVGGAPYLMAALTQLAPSYQMVFACSDRVSEEQHQADGTVKKINVFKHIGFVPMYAHMQHS